MKALKTRTFELQFSFYETSACVEAQIYGRVPQTPCCHRPRPSCPLFWTTRAHGSRCMPMATRIQALGARGQTAHVGRVAMTPVA